MGWGHAEKASWKKESKWTDQSAEGQNDTVGTGRGDRLEGRHKMDSHTGRKVVRQAERYGWQCLQAGKKTENRQAYRQAET